MFGSTKRPNITVIHILLMHTVLIGLGECVPALNFGDERHTNEFSPPICYPDTLPEEFGRNFTFCAFVKPSAPTEETSNHNTSTDTPEYDLEEAINTGFDGTIFSLFYNQTFMEAGFVDSKLQVTYGNESFTFDADFEPDVWRRICVYYEPYSSEVEATVGDYYVSKLHEVDVNETEHLEDYFCLGSPSESLDSFKGIITGVSLMLWDETDEEPVYFKSSDCSKVQYDEDSFMSIETRWVWDINGSIHDYDIDTLCSEAFTPITIKNFAGYKPHLDLCKTMNGRFITTGEVEADLIPDISSTTNSCQSIDEKLFWVRGEKSGSGLNRLCSVVLTNGTVSNQPCISELYCSLCLLPKPISFTLYGKVFDMDRSFSLMMLNDGEFYLKGSGASTIRHNGSYWVMSSSLHSNQWYLKNSIFPTGRNVWQSEEKNLTLTITQCNRGHFTCSNGDCIKRKSRCDGYKDCNMGEDEKECGIISLNDGYDKNNSPGFGETKQEYLYYALTVYSISDILTMDGKVTLDFLVYMEWYEYRMRYMHLKPKTQYFPCKDLWNPLITAMAGYDDGLAFDLDIYDSKCGLNKEFPQTHLDLDDHQMGEYLEGREYAFFMEIYSRLTIPCNFKLHRYPFGTYVCNISMYIRNGREEMAFEKLYGDEDVEVIYEHSHDLLDFRLIKITYETLHDVFEEIDYTNVLITLHLKSLYDYHVLNSFGPSSLIFIISWATFFFPVEDFNERIMVSLTSLLVLAALFSQASTTSVKTPYYKLLDVWYAILIALCFTAVIMITCVNGLRKKNTAILNIKVEPTGSSWYSKEKPFEMCPNRQAVICNMACKIILITLFIIVLIVYISLAAGMI